MMKGEKRFLFLLVLGAMVLSACLGKNDDTEQSSECALLTFSISDIKTPKTVTLEDGTDTTYVVQTPTSKCVFNIDQLNSIVYNTDSIPFGTQVEKVAVSCTASTSSSIYYNKNGERTSFTTGDTINFTWPVVFTIVSQDKKYSRDYTVVLNVRKVDPGESSWHKVAGTIDLAAMKPDVSALEVDFLASHTADHIFAFSYPLTTNATITRNLIVSYDDVANDSLAHVWTRLSTETEWREMIPSADNPYGCPLLENLMVVRYNGDLYAFGGQSKGGRMPVVEAFSRMFISVDNGVTWRSHANKLSLPEELKGYNGAFDAAVDEDKFLWIVLQDGTVWKGKQSSL